MSEISEENVENLPQAEGVILPVFMKKGDDRVQLGEMIFDPETRVGRISFNTSAGRDISELIGTGVLTGITFGGMMSANKITNKLN
jgi:hypothetical protein